MSLPVYEQRVLNRMEGALRASEPRLAAMYTMFARLNAGEPVGAESLSRGRLPRPRAAVCAIALIPAVFVVIVIGALLSGNARGATTCGTSQPAIRGAPMLSRASCPPSRHPIEAMVPGSGAAPKQEAIRAAHRTAATGSTGTSCPAGPRTGRPAASHRAAAVQQAAVPSASTGPPVAASGAC